jgi:PhoPQ-activated pathogenicity-related protein
MARGINQAGSLWRLVLAGLVGAATPGAGRAGLKDYVERPEPAFTWQLKGKASRPGGTVYELHLVSQVWQDIRWEHPIQVFVPDGVAPGGTMILWNTGGKPNVGDAMLAMLLAQKARVPCAFLYGNPNQPLLGGLREDGLIAETFVRFLATRDDNWPLLLPMVKSVVKGMDALQAFTEQEFKTRTERFIVSGASKRGWTSWLTAAADPRVLAICPMVIDTLNMPKQFAHQMASYGRYSTKIDDYTQRGLVPMPDTPEARRLLKIVDPFAYRDRLTLPKLIINGANDPYWTVDSLNLYWNELKGDKWVIYVPNAGHELQQKARNGGEGGVSRALNGLAAFARHLVAGQPMPRLEWKHEGADGTLRLTAEASVAPKAARLWVAHAPTRDFRRADWVEQTAAVDGGKVSGTVEAPKEGFCAFFAELDYEIDGVPYHLSTQVRVAGKPAPEK